MTRLNRLLLMGGVSSLVSLFSVATASLAQPSVQLDTQPPLQQTVPLKEPIAIQLQALDDNQKPLANVRFQLELLTPAKTPWLTTDFPMVEGTTLLALDAIAPTGTLQWQQRLPIRGNYHLQVTVSPLTTGAFAPFQQTLTLTVPENPIKYRNAAILAVVLLLVGVGGGWVIGARSQAQDGEVAAQPVRLLLSGVTVVAIAALLFVNIYAELAEASHNHSHHHESVTLPPAVPQAGNLTLTYQGETDAQVGTTADLSVQLADSRSQQPIDNAEFNIQVIGLEENELMFAYRGIPDANGTVAWTQQFFDGMPHAIQITASPSANADQPFPPLSLTQDVEVDGAFPPLSVRLISLAYLTAIAAVGLGAGFGLRRMTLPLYVSRTPSNHA